MNILIISTYLKWYNKIVCASADTYDTIKSKHAEEWFQSISNGQHEEDYSIASLFGDEDVKRTHFTYLFKRTLTNDRYIYVMPCPEKVHYSKDGLCSDLSKRQQFIAALLEDINEDINIFDDNNREVLLVAHDLDLFSQSCERSFIMPSDIIDEKLLEVLNKMSSRILIHGFTHQTQPIKRHILQVIETDLCDKTNPDKANGIIESLIDRINYINSKDEY